MTVRTAERAAAKRNESNCNLDAQTELCPLLWIEITVRTVECAAAKRKSEPIKLKFRCYEQTELCTLDFVVNRDHFSN